MINVVKLTNELTAAGIKISGCNADGVVWAEDGKTEIQKTKTVAAIIAAHDPVPIEKKSEIELLKERIAVLESKIALTDIAK